MRIHSPEINSPKIRQDPELKFWEAAAVRAAIVHGGADSVFIHSLDVSLQGRYEGVVFARALITRGTSF